MKKSIDFFVLFGSNASEITSDRQFCNFAPFGSSCLVENHGNLSCRSSFWTDQKFNDRTGWFSFLFKDSWSLFKFVGDPWVIRLELVFLYSMEALSMDISAKSPFIQQIIEPFSDKLNQLEEDQMKKDFYRFWHWYLQFIFLFLQG